MTNQTCAGNTPCTFALEAIAANSVNYYERLADRDGLPYFNVFWTDPAEAAHDWPDFGDVTARQLQGAIMLRHMTGCEAATEKVWYRKLLSYIDPSDGLLYRPETGFSRREADWGDNALTLYALITAYIDKGDPKLRETILKMTEGLLMRVRAGSLPEAWGRGFIIKPLMTCVRVLQCDTALELAKMLIHKVFAEDWTFTPDNTFRQGGHMHSNLRTLVGAADYALYTSDPVLYSRVDALYRYARSEATAFGFIPEVVGRKGDVVACETCALMDYAGLGITLANSGHPEYWGDMERLVRNHLVESQVGDIAWLRSGNSRGDTEQFTWRDIGPRLKGAYAGWSSPNHILACKETLHWGGPELRGKARAIQNCCGGSGVHALFIIWKNAASFENDCLSVHMHIDKKLPQAEIRCFQPWQGLLRIHLNKPCSVRARIPDFIPSTEARASVNSVDTAGQVWGNYLDFGHGDAGDILEMRYPLPVTTEEISVGNPGYRWYHYRVTWKGDTVLKMEPVSNDYATGYSEFEKADVPVYYGRDGPSPLYQRGHMLLDAEPKLTSLHLDDTPLNFWRLQG